MTAGEGLVYRFVNDVLSGNQPDGKDLIAVAKALLPIIERPTTFPPKRRDHCAADDVIERDRIMNEVAKNLGLKRKQGNGEAARKKWFEDAHIVAEFLLMVERIENEGTQPQKAEMMARSAFMEKLKIGDRAMRNKIRDHKAEALLLLPILRTLEAD